MTEENEKEDRQRITGPRVKKGLVIVNTGDGKGKTTAALGVLFRAWGRGMKVRMFQFIKNTGSRYGEQRAAEKIGIPILALGDGFTWLSKDLEQSGVLAAQQWENCKEALLSGQDDLIVFDEMTYALQFGWVSTEEVIETLKQRPEMLHVIITGRGAPQELIDYADLVTEMTEIKHPYKDQGIRAQPGIEF
jgi:cob(I)alamin adenosyltransferase